jgi:type II secretory pathway pseudopilin PulG
MEMSTQCPSTARRARLCASVAAAARAQRGDTLIEVVVGCLMVALLATATLTAFGDIGHITKGQRGEEQATALAQQDQARLRGLTIGQLTSSGTGTGNWAQPSVTIDGTPYTVTSAARFISGSTGSAACTGSGSNGSADEVQTTSTVTWGTNNDGRQPVIVHGLITPAQGGALVASVDGPAGLVTNPVNAGLQGVTVSISGPTATTPLTTDASGCVVFTGLSTGTYTVTYTPPAGTTWIQSNGSSTLPKPSGTVTDTSTYDVPTLVLGQASALTATFQTTFNGSTVATNSDQFMLATSGGITTPQTFGTRSTKTSNNFVSSIETTTSPAPTLFPYPSGYATDYYTAWAGGCAGDEPTGPPPTGFSISAGTSNQVVISEPAMIVLVWTGSSSSSQGSLVSTAPLVSLTDKNTGCSGVDYPPTQAPTATQGALVNPGAPYGNFTVCASATISGSTYRNTANVANTSFTAGNPVNIYLGSGASGRLSGACP